MKATVTDSNHYLINLMRQRVNKPEPRRPASHNNISLSSRHPCIPTFAIWAIRTVLFWTKLFSIVSRLPACSRDMFWTLSILTRLSDTREMISWREMKRGVAFLVLLHPFFCSERYGKKGITQSKKSNVRKFT